MPKIKKTAAKVLLLEISYLNSLYFFPTGTAEDRYLGGGAYSCSAVLISLEIHCFQGMGTPIYEYGPPAPNDPQRSLSETYTH